MSRLRLKFSPPGSWGHAHSLLHKVSEYLHDEHFAQTQLPTAANTAPSHTQITEDEAFPQGHFYPRQHPHITTRLGNFKKRSKHYDKPQGTAKNPATTQILGLFTQKGALPSTPLPPPGCGAAPARPRAEGGAGDEPLAAAAAPPCPLRVPKAHLTRLTSPFLQLVNKSLVSMAGDRRRGGGAALTLRAEGGRPGWVGSGWAGPGKGERGPERTERDRRGRKRCWM